MSEDVRSIIRDYIEHSGLLRRPGPLSYSDRLGTGGVLDSITIMELVVFLETRFGIEFSTRDLKRRRLETIEQIAQLVTEKRAASCGGATVARAGDV